MRARLTPVALRWLARTSPGVLKMRLSPLLACVVLLATSSSAAWCQSGGIYAVRKSTIDAGGGSSSGGDLRVRGTIGQPDATVQAAEGRSEERRVGKGGRAGQRAWEG